MRKIFLTVLFGAALGIGTASAAEVVVRVAPPRAIVESRPARPGPHYVWINGYHRWDGNAYRWEGGRWEAPPACPRSVGCSEMGAPAWRICLC